MALIAQIALGVIMGGLTIALLVMGFFVWNSRLSIGGFACSNEFSYTPVTIVLFSQ
jgi:hypothetical protein